MAKPRVILIVASTMQQAEYCRQHLPQAIQSVDMKTNVDIRVATPETMPVGIHPDTFLIYGPLVKVFEMYQMLPRELESLLKVILTI